jgi:hypothetical protein
MATGGSTNAVLHLIATAKDFGVKLTIDDFDRISKRTPVLADLKPWGNYTAPEMYEAGGMPLVGKRLLEAGLPARGREDGHRPQHRGRGEERRRAGGAEGDPAAHRGHQAHRGHRHPSAAISPPAAV